jgi:transcriptional regulator
MIEGILRPYERALTGHGGRSYAERMYVPRFNALDDAEEMRALVELVGSAQLVTVGPDGYPLATLLPVIWDDGRLVFHMARANQHWKAIADGSPALAVVTGPEAYVSPAWYASKAEHGRVVPTWNYSAVQFTGRVQVHPESAWLREAVTRLTDLHEGRRDAPWSVADAPATYVEKQLRAIVGIEMTVETVEGKVKLSQNRSEDDRSGVIAGLRSEGGSREQQVADAMSELD